MPSWCVCLCVILRYCIKTATCRITQIMSQDSPETLVFWCERSRRNSNLITPYGGDICKWGGLKSTTCDEKRVMRSIEWLCCLLVTPNPPNHPVFAFAMYKNSFLPRDALLSAVYAVVVCLSVCVCVCVCVRHTLVLYQNG